MGTAAVGPTTQRAYTLRLSGLPIAEPPVDSWADVLWKTHEAFNRGVRYFSDLILTLRAGLPASALARPPATDGPSSRTEPNDGSRLLLALCWLTVEDVHGGPSSAIVATASEPAVDREAKLERELRSILHADGISAPMADEWVRACRVTFRASVREDSAWVNRRRLFDAWSARAGCSREDASSPFVQLIRDLGWSPEQMTCWETYSADAAAGRRSPTDGKAKQAARNWFVRFFPASATSRSNATQVADALDGAAERLSPEDAGQRGIDVIRNVLAAMDTPTPSDASPKDVLAAFYRTMGYKGRGSSEYLRTEEFLDLASARREDIDGLRESFSEAAKTNREKGERQRQPDARLADFLAIEIERGCGIGPVKDKGKHDRFGPMLEQALRRVRMTWTWTCRREVERRSFERSLAEARSIPASARDWLDQYRRNRGQQTCALGEFGLRRRAVEGWADIVQAWAARPDVDAEARRQIVREIRSDGEIEKFGDARLFEDLAAEDARAVWLRDGHADSKVLDAYVEELDQERRRAELKVPSFRHPDALLHPAFADYGKSRWSIRYEVHQPARKSKKAARNGDQGSPPDARDVELDVFDGSAFRRMRLRWHSKRFAREIQTDLRTSGAVPVTRVTRLGRAAARIGKGVVTKTAAVLEQEKWNGRLQAPRDALRRIAKLDSRSDLTSEELARRRERAVRQLRWFLTLSAELEPRGPWIDYESSHATLLARDNDATKRRDPAKNPRKLACLPGLRILGVDLGHRTAAACAVWRTLRREEVDEMCRAAEVAAVGPEELFRVLNRLNDRGKSQRVVLRRIGADTLPTNEVGVRRDHPAPWALLERRFTIKLQGEDGAGHGSHRTPRKASTDEIDRLRQFERAVGRMGANDDLPSSHDLPRRIDEIVRRALETAKRALRRHGDAARIAFGLTAEVRHLPGGRTESLDTAGRTQSVLDALLRWHDLIGGASWNDAWARDLWDEVVRKEPAGLSVVDVLMEPTSPAAPAEQRRRLGIQLRPIAEALSHDGERARSVQEKWTRRWDRDDGEWRSRLRWLRQWIVPRSSKDANPGALRHVGGLSLTRIGNITELYRLERRYRSRPLPDNPRAGIFERGATDDRFGRRILEVRDRLRQQRVKQLVGRIVEAALGLGQEPTTAGRRSPKRATIPVYPPCHAVVIEDLKFYRADERQTRRENRQLLDWSAQKVRDQLEEACELHGLKLVAVDPRRTSCLDHVTGAPGIRCVDVCISGFLNGREWRTESLGARNRDARKRTPRDRLLLELDEQAAAIAKTGTVGRQVFRIPRRGGPIFLSCDPVRTNSTSSMAAATSKAGEARSMPSLRGGFDADINAAANVGLRAIQDPDWTGTWSSVLCGADGRPEEKEYRGRGFAPFLAAPTLRIATGDDGHHEPTTRVRKVRPTKALFRYWRDASARPLEEAEWRRTPDYWDDVERRAVQILRAQAGLSAASPIK